MGKEPKKIEVNGKMYTFRELSEMSGISPTGLRDRYRNGLRDDELINTERIVSKPKKWDEQMGRKKQEIFGNIMSLNTIAFAYGIKKETVYKRYNNGLRGEDIVYPPESDWKDTVRELWHGKWVLKSLTVIQHTGYRWNSKSKWVWKGASR